MTWSTLAALLLVGLFGVSLGVSVLLLMRWAAVRWARRERCRRAR